MSRLVTSVEDKYIEEIESMELCKYRINDICCNEKCEHLGNWFYSCDNENKCEHFEKEDGIIDDEQTTEN